MYEFIIIFLKQQKTERKKINDHFTHETYIACVAQWLEHLSRKQGVMSSILVVGSFFLLNMNFLLVKRDIKSFG
jgi:hypothetical protein